MIFRKKNKTANTTSALVQINQEKSILISEDQYSLPLKKSRLEWYYNLKNQINKAGNVAQVFPYWRNLNTSLAITSSVLLILVMLYMIAGSTFDNITEVPLVYKQATKSWELVDKEFLIALPVVVGAAQVMLINLSSSIYKFDRRLSFMLNSGLAVFNMLGIVGFYQLVSLLVIY
ncbi:MAG: hypothetical protein QY330_04840 [Candidatus Dojkabacteria bacterium]|uniref:Uncharacterized protein n=1 Tax=Candidatus Dojkabacteria bacterium TaxID=2099670 RepID=A0A952DVG0_9BACT|nr:hypothetical protein [Candidatus Dojkabacteria bacterium]WKZ27843.1 MAG: hypothetical protein QY330_04840 [Candidatus Dojkabacteria bacterium]